MGDTDANMAHWASLYPAGSGGGGAPAATEATVVTTVSSPTSGGSAGSPTRAQAQPPGVEGGRVGKPARRRSRASRRAPVTLLNTDTSNFRAMVQQFTGIPSGPYGPAAAAGPVISFGGGAGGGGDYGGGAALVRPSPTSAVMSFDHLAAASQHHHRPPASLQAQLFRPQQPYAGAGGTGDVGYGMHGGGDMAPFLHGFESSAEDRLLLQSFQAAQMMPTRPSSTSNTNGYNFG
ncbi:unnamed protein product [Urochloa humidicola]